MRRIARISGPSSYRLSLLVRVLLPTFLVLLFSMGAMATVARPANPPDAYFRAYFVVVALLVVTSLIFGVVAVIARVQLGREQSHGYTWSRGYNNLAMVDPVTMVVIREPGQWELSKQERAARVAAAREWALEHPEVT